MGTKPQTLQRQALLVLFRVIVSVSLNSCGSIGHTRDHERGRMMVSTSVHVEYTVSMRGWAIRYGTRNFHLPIPQHPTYLHLHPPTQLLLHCLIHPFDASIRFGMSR